MKSFLSCTSSAAYKNFSTTFIYKKTTASEAKSSLLACKISHLYAKDAKL